MPEPRTNKLGIDYYFYRDFINPLAEKICFINPNFITLLGLLLVIPLYNNLVNGGTIIKFVSISFFKFFLDCLDGAIARKCHKKSKLGALLDIANDSTSLLILFITVIKLSDSTKIYNRIFIMLYAILVYEFLSGLFNELIGIRTPDNMFHNKLLEIVHDNGTIISIIFSYLIKKSTIN